MHHDPLPSLLRRGGAVAAAAALLAAAACSADAAVEDPESAESAEAAPPLAFTPEPVFSAASQVDHIDGGVFYALYHDRDESRLSSRDLETGAMLAEAVPEHDVSFGPDTNMNGDAAFVTVDDRVLLFHAYDPDGALRLRAFDANDGSHVYTADQRPAFADGADVDDAEIVEINGEHLLVAVEDDRWGDASYLFDTATGELLWSRERFRAVSFQDGAVSGVAYPDRSADGGSYQRIDDSEYEVEFQVLSIDDDSTVWSRVIAGDPSTDDLGDGVVLIQENASMWNDTPDNVVLLNTADATALVETTVESDPECRYDQVAVVACIGLGEQDLTAYIAEDGSVLWTADDLPAQQILPDRFLAAYEGVLYMGNSGSDRLPVALEAATGEQIAENLPADLEAVGPGYCVTVTGEGDETMIHVHTEA